jgi:hypothetical protein
MQDATSITTETIKLYQCRHIFTDGHRCASPCLRHEEFCYYHHTTRRPVVDPRQRRSRRSTFDLPHPEDRSAIQSSIGEVLRRIAGNEIDPKRAGLLLYGLQIASINLPRASRATGRSSYNPRSRYSGSTIREEEDIAEVTLVEEIVIDPKLGTLAPRAEVVEKEEQLSVVGRLLRDLKRRSEEEDEEREEYEKAEAAKLKSNALAKQRLALDDARELQNTSQTAAIVTTIQAEQDPNQAAESLKHAYEHPKDPKNIAPQSRDSNHRCAKPLRQKKSPKKLTRRAQIAIVRGFREYSDRAIRETRCAEGWRKAQANKSLPLS